MTWSWTPVQTCTLTNVQLVPLLATTVLILDLHVCSWKWLAQEGLQMDTVMMSIIDYLQFFCRNKIW